jgi:beta-xylosidase
VTGVARSKKLLGPWEKYEKNPILAKSNTWICPGHGTPAEFSGRYYFLYHAYSKQSNVYTGRQGMLQQFTFTADGWVKFEDPDPVVLVDPMPVNDEFDTQSPLPSWQWSVFSKPEFSQRNGRLYLSGTTAGKISYVALRTESYDYHVRVALNRKETTAQAGLAIIGDDEHIAGVQVKDRKIIVYSRNGKSTTEHIVGKLPNSDVLYLELKVDHGKNIVASYSLNNKEFIPLNATPFDVSFMPPWDRALRAGVTAVGSERQVAVFDMFSIK